jgi:hypothetical protein
MRWFKLSAVIGFTLVSLATGWAGEPQAGNLQNAEKQTLQLAVKGSFAVNKPIRLNAEKSSFVAPAEIEIVRLGPNTVFVDVRFEFKGTERRSRQIEVKLTVAGEGGRVIAEDTHICSDQRIYAREQSGKRRGTRAAFYSLTNTEKFVIPANAVNKIRRVELQFREVENP